MSIRSPQSYNDLPDRKEVVFQGIAVGVGIAEGRVIIHREEVDILPYRDILDHEIEFEIDRFKRALESTRKEIRSLQDRLSICTHNTDAMILDAHLMFLEDPGLIDEVILGIRKKKNNAELIFQTVSHRFIKFLGTINDSYLSERSADLADVSRRVMRHLLGKSGEFLARHNRNHIIVSKELTPSDTATLNRDNIGGILMEKGSKTSHSAIMARALGIPSIVGLVDICNYLENGDMILMDGYTGRVFLNPTPLTKENCQKMALTKESISECLELLRDEKAVTLDNKYVILSANIEIPEELNDIVYNGAEGIGLYRTEFLYFNRKTPPNEEEHYQVYYEIARRTIPYSVIIRTLDIGGDKPSQCLNLVHEENPFLGCRSIRYCLNNPDIFKIQLRAILRANVHGNIRLMFPMISGIEELQHAKFLLQEVIHELEKKNIEHNSDLEIGIMIEVPSAAIIAEHLAEKVSFFSIGTNDLLQYLMAVDRGNQSIAHLYDPANPAVIRMLKHIIDCGHQAGIWVGLCGELASDIEYTPILLGLGIDELSMTPSLLPRVKKAIRNLKLTDCQELNSKIFQEISATEIYAHTLGLAHRCYPDLFYT